MWVVAETECMITSTNRSAPLNFRFTTQIKEVILQERPHPMSRSAPFCATLCILLTQRSNRTISASNADKSLASETVHLCSMALSLMVGGMSVKPLRLIVLKQTFLNTFSLISRSIIFRMGGSNVEQGQVAHHRLEFATFLRCASRYTYTPSVQLALRHSRHQQYKDVDPPLDMHS